MSGSNQTVVLIKPGSSDYPSVKFVSDGSVPRVYLRTKSTTSFVIQVSDTSQVDSLYRLDMVPVGEYAQESTPTEAVLKNVTHNYYLPHCPDGITVPGYNRIIYEDIYPDIDLHFYGASAGQKMAIVCRPGSDPNHVKLQFTGQDSMNVDVYGFLKLYYSDKFVSLPYALAYQVDANGNMTLLNWGATYNTDNVLGLVSFYYEAYDPTKALVFLVGALPLGGGGGTELGWSTLLGTQNGVGYSEFITAGAADADGNLFVAGNTRDQAFPANTGLVTHAGGYDVVYGKFNYAPGDPDEDARLVWMTYYGGAGSDKPTVIHHAADTENSGLFVAGWTNSSIIPILPEEDPLDGTYYQNSKKGTSDGFILLADAADGTLQRSTYYGGEGEEMITAIAEDHTGNIFLGGVTTSLEGSSSSCTSPTTGFPLCDPGNGAYQQTANAGGTDAFCVRITPGFQLLWSTFYGGAEEDHLYDGAFLDGLDPSVDRVVFVGSTRGNLPYQSGSGFQLAGSGNQDGFVVTFDGNMVLRWGTNLHQVIRLEAVTAYKDRIVVMGLTHYNAPTSNTCAAANGLLSICTPGDEYMDDVVTTWDNYFADFVMPNGDLKWSTCYGDQGGMGAMYEEEYAGIHLFNAQQHQPFQIHRLSDLEVDADENIYALGLFQHWQWGLDDHVGTVPAFGLYNQDWNPLTGQDQTDISLFVFSKKRELMWMSLFGGGFDQVDTQDFFGFDYAWQHKGCDFGQDLVLVRGEALYWVGTSGGVALPEQCPYPQTSWCESSLVNVGDNLDYWQGFMTRMNLRGVTIGVEDLANTGSVLSCYPNPATEMLQLWVPPTVDRNAQLVIVDALGRAVLHQPLGSGQVRIDQLATGVYSALLYAPKGALLGSVRFTIQ